MNILFYVEPLIERDDPYWKTGWVTGLCFDYIKTLKQSSTNFNFLVAMNEGIEQNLEEELIEKVVFTQEELLSKFNNCFLEASKSWYLETYTIEQLEYYKNLMKNKLGNFIPDIIISFTPVPFLKSLFPNALTLYHEFSIFSRMPFPKSWFFDPSGVFEKSFLSTFKDDINLKLNLKQMGLLASLKSKIYETFLVNNPFVEKIVSLRNKYEYLVLLPLQFSNYYAFDALAPFKSQYEYLIYVLNNVPQNIAVIITMHPQYPVITDNALKFIKSKYNNAVFIEETKYVNAASQYILPLIDAVITVSSSTGIQTILFDKKLITLGSKCFDFISDANSLNNLLMVLKKEKKSRDAFLYFYITKYAILDKYISNTEWLENFFKNSLKKYRTQGIDCDFYENIDKDEVLFSYLEKVISENLRLIPEINWISNQYSWENSVFTVFAQLYLDLGQGFNENNKIIAFVKKNDKTFTTRFILNSDKKIIKLRFDPVEKCGGICKILRISTDAEVQTIKPVNADDFSIERGNQFLNCDPQYLIEGNFSSIRYLEIEYEFTVLDVSEIHSLLIAERDKAIAERDKAIAEHDNEIAERDNEKEKLNKVIEELDNEIAKLDNEIAKRDKLIEERDKLKAERDGVIAERDAIYQSRAWQCVCFFRRIKKALKL